MKSVLSRARDVKLVRTHVVQRGAIFDQIEDPWFGLPQEVLWLGTGPTPAAWGCITGAGQPLWTTTCLGSWTNVGLPVEVLRHRGLIWEFLTLNRLRHVCTGVQLYSDFDDPLRPSIFGDSRVYAAIWTLRRCMSTVCCTSC